MFPAQQLDRTRTRVRSPGFGTQPHARHAHARALARESTREQSLRLPALAYARTCTHMHAHARTCTHARNAQTHALARMHPRAPKLARTPARIHARTHARAHLHARTPHAKRARAHTRTRAHTQYNQKNTHNAKQRTRTRTHARIRRHNLPHPHPHPHPPVHTCALCRAKGGVLRLSSAGRAVSRPGCGGLIGPIAAQAAVPKRRRSGAEACCTARERAAAPARAARPCCRAVITHFHSDCRALIVRMDIISLKAPRM